ncbi:PREDICTED: 2'-deoxynucleoside 5'-phosphate N-hydrolase 1-like [Priapulus caudatus]|uniref:Putative 2'-deoxynucleoside 5'-phosphate N-hydrolase 1 n=1 Tax=Priapulus caudatus TaxID=37621 RepID=A0ABM1ED00_PRICU|nr:PREDICTED: 2'-deoxynucleoside 5'-phosphate N-hydrolase 1-like [Priapulus caudatus]XP_014670071.1 PREDICTED: 2'-deoxynucleoside 5'-phosphate N-hydrolase 1-like [Priapulus caudatus]
MDIYFSGSIRGGRQDVEVYQRVIKLLQQYGAVLTENNFKAGGGGDDEKDLDDREIHDRCMAWLEQAEVVVAEVTQPSLGVGYEIAQAVGMDKRILCLFRESTGKKLSAMIRGCDNEDTIIVKDYKEADLPAILQEFFTSVQAEAEGDDGDEGEEDIEGEEVDEEEGAGEEEEDEDDGE